MGVGSALQRERFHQARKPERKDISAAGKSREAHVIGGDRQGSDFPDVEGKTGYRLAAGRWGEVAIAGCDWLVKQGLNGWEKRIKALMSAERPLTERLVQNKS